MYYQDIDASSASIEHKSFEALCNALVVVGFIACLTFGIVLLYKFDCIKFFLGYCVFYSATLLGFVGAKIVVLVLCDDWHVVVDKWSLGFVMYNFAVVGVLSIFYQKGIPARLEQGYLITTSVIVAWQLSQLPEVLYCRLSIRVNVTLAALLPLTTTLCCLLFIGRVCVLIAVERLDDPAPAGILGPLCGADAHWTAAVAR